MTLDTRNPLEVVFRGDRLTVGFSLIRPMLTRLDWNYFGDRPPVGNRLLFKGSYGGSDTLGGQNGPSYITAAGNFVPQNMTGSVEVAGTRVMYRGIITGAGITVDAVFTVTAEALLVTLEQEAETDLPVIEGEAWRLLWNMRAGLTSVAALPQVREGRNGFVELPALIAADDGGTARHRSAAYRRQRNPDRGRFVNTACQRTLGRVRVPPATVTANHPKKSS